MEKKIIIKINLFLLFTFSFIFGTFAQKNDLDSFRLSFDLTALKQSDNSVLLEVEFLGRNKKNKKVKVPVNGAEVNFYNVFEDEEILLGKSNTNMEGNASIVVSADQKFLFDEEGYTSIVARYDGNDIMEEEESEWIYKDLLLDLEFNTEDSTRTIIVNAYTIDSLGEKQDVEELDLKVGIQGMLSELVLEESTLEEGEFEYELPEDIHGNMNGELTLFARVEDHEDFGNIIKTVKVKDSYPIVKSSPEKNKLWTDAAPIWMYIVLSILLVGIWANYIYTIRNLVKIKKIG